MPKKTYKILRFDGGINNNSDARDLAENELADLKNVSVDEVGMITVLGDLRASLHTNVPHKITIPSSTTTGGKGLMTVATDRDNFLTNADTRSGQTANNPQNYFIAQDGDDIEITNMNQGGSETYDEIGIDYVDGSSEMSAYWMAGALRAYEANHENDVTPKWRGHIMGATYGVDETALNDNYQGYIYNSGGSLLDQWYTTDAKIIGCFPEESLPGATEKEPCGVNLIMFQNRSFLGSIGTRGNDTDGFEINAEPVSAAGFQTERCNTGAGPNVQSADRWGGSSYHIDALNVSHPNGDMTPTASNSFRSGMLWGFQLGYHELADGTGGWAPNGDELYQFYCTTIYDGVQESLPQLFCMYASGPQMVGAYDDNAFSNAYQMENPVRAIQFGNGEQNVAGGDDDDAYGNFEKLTDKGQGISLHFSPKVKWNGAWINAQDEASTLDYNFGAPPEVIEVDGAYKATGTAGEATLKFAAGSYSGNLQGLVAYHTPLLTEVDGNPATDYFPANTHMVAYGSDGGQGAENNERWIKMSQQCTTSFTNKDTKWLNQCFVASGGNPRITGLKVYWASSDDGFVDKWQLCEWDFRKGLKPIGASGDAGGNYAAMSWAHQGQEVPPGCTSWNFPWSTFNTYYHQVYASDDDGWGFEMQYPPRFLRYDAMNGHASDETIHVDGFKASVTANNRVYIGNVKINGVVYGDRMIKSAYSLLGPAPDKFPANSNHIDVATEDGDEIVALQEYADRILQFKRNTCYIINISGASEFLESKNDYKGISNPAACCKTDYGVAWVNTHGAYLYDGKVVRDLLEEKGIRKISKLVWEAFIDTNGFHKIGYLPSKRQILVIGGDTHTSKVYLYDLTTRSWTFADNMFNDPNTSAPLINSPLDGNLLVSDDGGNDIDEWQDNRTTGPIAHTTKVKCIADDDSSLNGKYFIFYDGGGPKNVIMFDVGGTNPTAPVVSQQYTLEVELAVDDTANAIALKLATALTNSSDIDVTAHVDNGDEVIIVDDVNLIRFDAVDVDTGFDINTIIWGSNSSVNETDILIRTKDIDFGEPAVRKNVSRLYITYSSGHADLDVKYGVNGGLIDNQCDGGLTETSGTGRHEAELKFTGTESTSSIKSIQIEIVGNSSTYFQLYDMSLVYRTKSVK